MAVSKLSNRGRSSAIALALMALTLPGIASAEPGGEDRGGWRGRGGDNEAAGNISAGGWNRPAPQPQPQQTWAGRGGGGNDSGGWSHPQAPERVAPVAVPVPQAAPAPSANWSGDRGQRGGWNGGGQAGGTNSGGGWSGGQRGGGGGWNGGGARQPTPAPAPAPAPAPQQRWNGGEGRSGEGWNRPAPSQGGWNGNYTTSPNRDRNHDQNRDRNRNWSGNQGWSGSHDRDRSHDGDRYRSNNNWNRNQGWSGSRHGYNQDYRRWDNRWRSNSRYDWNSYRRGNPGIYRMGSYYAPYRGYSYRRLSIGFFLDSLFFSQNYWINDPWQYRLPDVYGPYRWVRYYDDALLVNVYTGEVVDVINNFFW